MTQTSLINTSELLNGEEDVDFILEPALLLAQDYLLQFAQSPDFSIQVELIFGPNINNNALNVLKQQWLSGSLVFPTIRVLSLAQLNGADGAFATSTQTIYLAREYLLQNADNPQLIADTLLEEYGHFVDSLINTVDAQGDEGHIFSALVRGEPLSTEELQRLQREDDTAIITVDGTSLQVEQANGDYSLSFDGVDDYVAIPHDESLSLTTFTVEAWVNPSQIKGDWQPLITKEESDGWPRNYAMYIAPNTMTVTFAFAGTNLENIYSSSQSSLILNKWNHIAMTYDGSSFKFYLNGNIDGSINTTAIPLHNTEPIKIGKMVLLMMYGYGTLLVHQKRFKPI